MPVYVLDTSVVLQWFERTDEIHVKEAKRIFDDLNSGKINVIIPDLLLIEILNALLIGKKCSLENANLAIRRLFDLPLTILAISLPVLEESAKLMRQHNLASYDAYFLALAHYEKCKLISDDQKAHGQVKDGSVIMLEDYS